MAITVKLPCAHPFGQEWEIDSVLGEGSYGIVYQVSKNVAGVKLTSAMKWIPLPGDDAEVRNMYAEGASRSGIREYYTKLQSEFSKEIQLLYKLHDNSHVVYLEDSKIIPREGENAVGYDIYIRMELLTPLEKWLKQKRNIKYRDIVQLGEDICDALSGCYKLGIIHRDIKPDNIFVSNDHRYKLGDFGIARQLQKDDLEVSQRVGNDGYMSPEVYHGQTYDLRADIYSLGLVLYKLLNRRREPFARPAPDILTPQDAREANQTRLSGAALPKPQQLIAPLERLWDIIQKACEFQPSNRYQTPMEMKKALQSIESLPALDEQVEIFPTDGWSKEKESEDEVNQTSHSSDEISGTHHRNTSSEDELNKTGKRTSSSGYKSGLAPAPSAEPAKGTETEGKPIGGGLKTVPRKWMYTAAGMAFLLVCGIIYVVWCAVYANSTSAKWAFKAESISATAVTLSWNISEAKDCTIVCLQNDAQIRKEAAASSPLTVTGLVPGKEYVFKLSSGNESAQISATTISEDTSGRVPAIQRVDLFSIKTRYLENTTLSQVDGNYFDHLSDHVIHLRSGPIGAQIVSNSVWVLFSPIANGETAELIISAEIPGQATFSRGASLNLAASNSPISYRVSLDELLGDIYMSYHSWPQEKCTLHLYVDGMSVYETTVQFVSED